MKVMVVASTRPEVIKLASILKALKKKRVEYVFATTGQHYDELLFKKFIEELGLDEPNYNVQVGSASQGVQTGLALIRIEELFTQVKPDIVVVEGDTNSVLGSALASVKLKIPVAHVEAGLRSFDRTMPEEINRILADHCSEVLFAPTEISALNLVNEGIPPKKIHVVGNTIVDASLTNLEKAQETSKILEKFPKDYLLLTLHRQENTDDHDRLKNILTALGSLKKTIIFPIHPRTSKIVKGTELEKLLEVENIKVIPPVGYLDFLILLKNTFAVFTDSGGVQEEAITLSTPCLTLRYNTERPESVSAGGNIIVGTKKTEIIEKIALLDDPEFRKKMKEAPNPFGDGRTGDRIVDILVKKYKAGLLKVMASDTRSGYISRSLLRIEGDTAGKTVKDSGYEIFKIIDGEAERFPYPDFLLKQGQFIEVVKRG
jgi:UDP-N-acetylglucosamine 2-epimerase (non-hydrolysing)